MQVKLDENNYFTGSYAKIGGIQGGVNVENLPDESDVLKQLAYKLIDGVWQYDNNKYEELLTAQNNITSEKSTEEKFEELSKQYEQLAEAVDFLAMEGVTV